MEGVLIIWGIIWGAICAWLAGEKGRGGGAWFFLGLLFGPIALLILGFSPKIDHEYRYASTASRKSRPDASGGQFRAGIDIPFANQKEILPEGGSSVISEMRRCPDCDEEIRMAAKVCRYCRHDFSDGTVIEPGRADEQPQP